MVITLREVELAEGLEPMWAVKPLGPEVEKQGDPNDLVWHYLFWPEEWYVTQLERDFREHYKRIKRREISDEIYATQRPPMKLKPYYMKACLATEMRHDEALRRKLKDRLYWYSFEREEREANARRIRPLMAAA